MIVVLVTFSSSSSSAQYVKSSLGASTRFLLNREDRRGELAEVLLNGENINRLIGDGCQHLLNACCLVPDL